MDKIKNMLENLRAKMTFNNKKFLNKDVSKKYDIKKPSKVKKTKRLYLSDLPRMNTFQKAKILTFYFMVLLWAIIIIYPLVMLFLSATNNKGRRETLSFKDGYSFGTDGFTRVMHEGFGKWMTNSLIISLVSMVLIVFIVGLVGFAFSRFNFKAKNRSLLGIMILRIIPTITALIAFYIMGEIFAQKFNLERKYTLIMLYVGGGIVGNIYILKSYMDNIPRSIDESARIDGVGVWKQYWRMIAPLSLPMLSMVAFWSFIGPFGGIILPNMLINDPENFTVAQGLRGLITDGNAAATDYIAYTAGAIMVAIPSLILFIPVQRFMLNDKKEGSGK